MLLFTSGNYLLLSDNGSHWVNIKAILILKALYTATDAEDVAAAAKMFEKKIYVWILEMLHFPGSVFDRPLYKKKEGS